MVKVIFPFLDFKTPGCDGGKLWRNIWDIFDLPEFSSISYSERITVFTWVPQLIYLILLLDILVNLEQFKMFHNFEGKVNNKLKTLSDDLINEYVYLVLQRNEVMRIILPELRSFVKPVTFRRVQRIYCGYDTEYQVIDSTYNDLISRQLVSTSTLGLRILNSNLTFDFSKQLSGLGKGHLTELFNDINEMWNLLNCFKTLFYYLKPGVLEFYIVQKHWIYCL